MTVYELVTKLQDFPSDMTVALADWNFGESSPCIWCLDEIKIRTYKIYNDKITDWEQVTCVVIGKED